MKKILVLTFFLVATFASAQEEYTLSDASSLSIDGTSTLHDWTVTANSMEGSIVKTGNENTVEFTVPVDDIRGDKDAMNKKMHNALKKEAHPNVLVSVSGVNSSNGGEQNLLGTMTIAGLENDVSIATTVSQGNGQLQLTGKQTITLQDYDIKPPTAMFGTIVVGDEVTVKFDLIFERE